MDFLRKLEAIIDTDTDESELKSMEIFRIFLSTEQKLYLNVEMVIQVLCDAATSMSVESVVESWVSIYEAHSNKHIQMSNERAEKEICVAVYGPHLPHINLILKDALNLMYKTSKDTRDRGGRFIRRNNNTGVYTVYCSCYLDISYFLPQNVAFRFKNWVTTNYFAIFN